MLQCWNAFNIKTSANKSKVNPYKPGILFFWGGGGGGGGGEGEANNATAEVVPDQGLHCLLS